MPVGGGLSGQRADDVVRLVAIQAQDRDPHRLQNLLDPLHLDRQILRHGRPIGLVLGEDLRPERRRLAVHGHGDHVRLLLLDQPQQGGRENVRRLGRLAGRARKLLPHRGKVSRVNMGMSVNDVQGLRHCSNLICSKLNRGIEAMSFTLCVVDSPVKHTRNSVWIARNCSLYDARAPQVQPRHEPCSLDKITLNDRIHVGRNHGRSGPRADSPAGAGAGSMKAGLLGCRRCTELVLRLRLPASGFLRLCPVSCHSGHVSASRRSYSQSIQRREVKRRTTANQTPNRDLTRFASDASEAAAPGTRTSATVPAP